MDTGTGPPHPPFRSSFCGSSASRLPGETIPSEAFRQRHYNSTPHSLPEPQPRLFRIAYNLRLYRGRHHPLSVFQRIRIPFSAIIAAGLDAPLSSVLQPKKGKVTAPTSPSQRFGKAGNQRSLCRRNHRSEELRAIHAHQERRQSDRHLLCLPPFPCPANALIG